MRALLGVEEFGVEALVVLASGEVLLERDSHGLVHQLTNIYRSKEFVFHDFVEVSVGPQSGLLVLVQQSQHDVNEVIGVVDLVLGLVGEDHLGLLDLQEKKLTLSVVERGHANEHLINQDSHGPPVDGEVMALMGYHLRSEVLWGSTEGLA